ncbi:unnamed protein product [Cochlearia groenlandica]
MLKTQLCICFIILYLSSEQIIMRVRAQAHSQGDWCIANPVTDEEKLKQMIDFACSKIDCRIIMEGGACFCPNTLINHASVAMNLYYQAQGRHYWNCNFEGSGLITVTDPSYCNCKYQYRT